MIRSFLFLAMLSATALGQLNCLTKKVNVIPRQLPNEVEMGIANTHSDPSKLISVFVPIPSNSVKGQLFDFHLMENKLPQKFLVGDGSLERVIIGIDQRPGTRLSLCLNELANRLTDNGRKTPEATLEEIRSQILNYLAPVPEEDILPWDETLPEPGDVSGFLERVRSQGVKAPPIPTGKKLKVVPLESYLQYGESYCLQKSILTALLMQQLKQKFKVVFGGGEAVGSGHNWIKLSDGRYLDTTWQILQKPTTEGALPGWFRHGSSWMFLNQRYLFLGLP